MGIFHIKCGLLTSLKELEDVASHGSNQQELVSGSPF